MLIKLALEEGGVGDLAVEEIGSGEALYEYLDGVRASGTAAHLPEFVMLDISMPRVDGLTALRAIRAADQFSHVPVIMCSTSTQAKVVDECLALGANEYRSKPSDFERLVVQMRELTGKYRTSTSSV